MISASEDILSEESLHIVAQLLLQGLLLLLLQPLQLLHSCQEPRVTAV